MTQSWEKTDEKGTRWLPSRGNWDRTAGQLVQELNRCNGDIGAVVGDYNPDAGAWIRFNPLNGKDCTNENVTDFRYALVESDDMELEKQNALIRELELLLDFLWHTERHELCHPAHLICESEEVAQKMTENLEKDAGCPVDIEEAEKNASEDVVAQREEALAQKLAEMKRRKRKLVDPLQFEMSIQAEDLLR